MTTVLLTGASSGIGATTALGLDRAGMTVFAGFRDPGDAGPLLKGASDRLQVLALDITDAQSIAAAVANLDAQLARAAWTQSSTTPVKAFPGRWRSCPSSSCANSLR